jgi:hypothetical protein
MGCLSNKLQNIKNCQTSLGGIRELYIGQYSKNFYGDLKIVNGVIVDVKNTYRFVELSINQFNSKYNTNYNLTTNKYENSFDFEIVRMENNKRDAVNSLVKSTVIIIFKDWNGEYFILGEKSGMKNKKFTGSTDNYNGKNSYQFSFEGLSDYIIYNVDKSVVDKLSVIDCSVLWTELALSSLYLWENYSDCLIGDFPDFVEP